MDAHTLDAAFLSYAERGDRESLERLWAEAAPWVYRLAYRVLRDSALAEDATQAVAVKLLRARPSGPVASPKSWLAAVAVREALQMARRRGAEQSRLLEKGREVPMIDEGPSGFEEREEARLRVQREIHKLPDALRLPLVLQYWEGLSHREIAQSLDCPEGTVASRLHEAKARLKQGLAVAGLLLGTAGLEDALAQGEAVPMAPCSPAEWLERASRAPGSGTPAWLSSPASLAAGAVLLGSLGFYAWRGGPPAPAAPAAPVAAASRPPSPGGPAPVAERAQASPAVPAGIAPAQVPPPPTVRAVALAGRVLDGRGAGRGGVTVRASLPGASAWSASVVTAGDGAFEVGGIPRYADPDPGDPYALLARVEQVDLEAEDPAGGRGRLAVRLEPGPDGRCAAPPLVVLALATLSVKVVDGTGQPVVGAGIGVEPPQGDVHRVFTQGDGKARFEGLEAGLVSLSGPFPNRTIALEPGKLNEIVVPVSRTRVESIVVDGSGRPVEGLTVLSLLEPSLESGGPRAETDGKGHFVLEGLQDGGRFTLTLLDIGSGRQRILSGLDPAHWPAEIRFGQSWLKVKLEGAVPPSGIAASVQAELPDGSRKTLWCDVLAGAVIRLDTTGASYKRLRFWIYADGCEPVEGEDLGGMAEWEQREVALVLSPASEGKRPSPEELERLVGQAAGRILAGLASDDWTPLDGSPLDPAFLQRRWPAGELPPDLDLRARQAARNIGYVRSQLAARLGDDGLRGFAGSAGKPLDYARRGELESFRFDLGFSKDGVKAGFGVWVYRIGNEERYDVYGVHADAKKGE